MTKFWSPIIVSLFLAGSVSASGFVTLGKEAKIPLADGWAVVDDSGAFPYRLIRDDQSAELSIFKSIVSSDETIKNEQELKYSVDKVIEDVIMSLPEARLLANTGYFDRNRVWFDLDFESWDIDREVQMRHRLKGVLYQHPDGYQILFSLWGKAIEGASAVALSEMRLMQEEFSYTGVSKREVFPDSSGYDWYLIGLLFAILIVALLVMARRKQRQQIMLSRNANVWRCACGRLNDNDNETCRQCGLPRPADNIS